MVFTAMFPPGAARQGTSIVIAVTAVATAAVTVVSVKFSQPTGVVLAAILC